MSDLIVKLITGLLRVLLVPFTDWLVAHDILTSDETVQFVAEAASWGIAISWTVIAWIRQHRRERTALAMPTGSTPTELSQTIESGHAAPLLTASDEVPRLGTKGLP